MLDNQTPSAVFGRAPSDSKPTIVRSEGIRMWDAEGNEYIDGSSGAISVVSVGHGRREVLDAMAAQAGRVAYVQGGMLGHDAAEELARELVRFTPGNLNTVMFVSGGSEANESAIKLARQYHLMRGKPEKHIVISRARSYHGNTIGALTLSGYQARRQPYLPFLPREPQVVESNCYRCPFGLTYPECELACANDLERAITEAGADQVAAFIAEPIVAAAGPGMTPPPGYFERVREICDAHDILFIADEVVTGLGRTGANFGVDHWGVVPDIITTAKGLSGGYVPLGAMIVGDHINDVFRSAGARFQHGYTYMQHPIACAAGLAVLRIIEREDLIDNAADQGEYLFARLRDLQSSNPHIGDVRGMGLLAGIELVQDRPTRLPLDPALGVTTHLLDAARARGLMLYAGQSGDGLVSDQFLVSPPLTVTRAEIDEIIERLTLALQDIQPLMEGSSCHVASGSQD
jgi:adenosylmethionine-8-amino-7-oxononanoate aminotransferase